MIPNRILLLSALLAGLTSIVLSGCAIGVPMSLVVLLPANAVGIGGTWLTLRLTCLGAESSAILARQLALRLAITIVGPVGVILAVLLVGQLADIPRSGPLPDLLAAATTFALKRNEVRGALFGAYGWLLLSTSLEVVAVRKMTSSRPSRTQVLAACASSGVTLLSAVAWATAYQSLLA